MATRWSRWCALEDSRQPAVYYLAGEPAEGPHLICDWNGAPTALGELELDILSELGADTARRITAGLVSQQQKRRSTWAASSSPPPLAADLPLTPPIASNPSEPASSLLSQEDGSHFDLLTVPPVPAGLLKRLAKRARLAPDHSSNNLAETDNELASSSSSNPATCNGSAAAAATAAATATSKHQPKTAPVQRKLKEGRDKCLTQKQRARMAQRRAAAGKSYKI